MMNVYKFDLTIDHRAIKLQYNRNQKIDLEILSRQLLSHVGLTLENHKDIFVVEHSTSSPDIYMLEIKIISDELDDYAMIEWLRDLKTILVESCVERTIFSPDIEIRFF